VESSGRRSSEKVGWWALAEGRIGGGPDVFYPWKIIQNIGANLCNSVHFRDIRSSNVGWKIDDFPSHFKKWDGIHCPCRIGSVVPGGLKQKINKSKIKTRS